MEHEQMTIHRALTELKLIDSRIEKAISVIEPIGVMQTNKPVNGFFKKEDFEAETKAKLQSVIGNEFDLQLLDKLLNLNKLNKHLLKDNSRGLEGIQNNKLREYFNINEIDFNRLQKKQKTKLQEQFAKERYLHIEKDNFNNIPYIYNTNNIKPFSVVNFDGFLNENNINKSNFKRIQKKEIFTGNKIVLNRFGNKINAHYINYYCYFSTYFYVLKLNNDNLYPIITAILNSDLINYFLTQHYRMRVNGNYTNLDTKAIKNIPIPKDFDNDIFNEISKLSQQLTIGELYYENTTKEKLNELIYDLYDLSYLERQRIKDFFVSKRVVNLTDMEKYKETLSYTLEMYFENMPKIEYSINLKLDFDTLVVGIFFNKDEEMPKTEKVLKYEVNKIMQQTNNDLVAMRGFLIGKDCIYIFKNRQLKNWTETKAYEDGKLILKNLS